METAIKEPEKKAVSREQFLSAIKPSVQSFFAEGVGEVVIRPISLKDREQIKSGAVDVMTGRVNEAAFISLTVLKGLVEPKLTDSDVAQLQDGNFGAVKKISERIWNISGIAEAETQKNA